MYRRVEPSDPGFLVCKLAARSHQKKFALIFYSGLEDLRILRPLESCFHIVIIMDLERVDYQILFQLQRKLRYSGGGGANLPT